MAVDQLFDLDLRIHERSPGVPTIVAADFSDEGSECHRTDMGSGCKSLEALCTGGDCHPTQFTCGAACTTDDCETQPHNGCKTDAHCPTS